MASLSKTTRDHEEIRRWVETRGGKPAHVKRTGSRDDIGILRIDFPGYTGEGTLEPIEWDQFFEKFDDRGLSFLYQEETAGGERSNFNKLVSGATASRGARKSGAAASKRNPSARRSSGTAKKAAKKSAGARTVSKSAARAKKATSTKKKAASTKKSSSRRPSSTKKAASRKTASKRAAKRRR
jgi:hypothetical protein